MGLARNDIRQYDELAGEWWRPGGALAPLRAIAAARARLVPPASRPGAILVDVGCGGGLLAPYLDGKGYRHIGLDLVTSALEQAAAHGVTAIRADATRLPLVDRCADVVSAGELLEHVTNWRAAVAEVSRILRPGGLVVLDTLNNTVVSRLLAVTVAERLPGVPRGLHDPNLFVNPDVLIGEFARHGVRLEVRGVRPAFAATVRWLVARRREIRVVPTWSTAVLYQARGRRAA
ncbi:MAG TPA: methyltransferase domain-containing protein [Micromonosporaceae bacterium]|nr:methyltransferase domain-containing protein [Micromonosporaceae bacterium]